MTEWKPLTARITFLPTSAMFPAGASPLEMFRAIFLQDPQAFNKQTNPLAASSAQGLIDGIKVNLVCAIPRVDINFAPGAKPGADEDSSAFSTIESAPDLQKLLLKSIESVGGALSLRAARVAVAIQFVSLVSSVREANGIFQSVVPRQYSLKLEDEDDFVFQVNTPFVSKSVASVSLNFVRNWSTVRFQVLNFAVAANAGYPPVVFGDSSHAMGPQTSIGASVNFEVNNVPTLEPISIENQRLILLESLSTIQVGQRETGLNVEGF
ncbi:hypothetical protein [Occallatibacter savannae]|uniref:hypothetical protein n=1 Tax=Occallatibacter savannae TaxID=1002691 RepID=UPI000D69728C|nr:hypothetical protein [Occallatibacter savannae]